MCILAIADIASRQRQAKNIFHIQILQYVTNLMSMIMRQGYIALATWLAYCVILEWVSYGRQLPMTDQDLV